MTRGPTRAPDDLPNGIRAKRLQAGLSMKALADRLGWADTQISKLELGERQLRVDQAVAIAAALDCSIADLLPAVDIVRPNEKALLDLFGTLDPDRQAMALRLIAALRAEEAALAEAAEGGDGDEDAAEAARKAG